MSDSNRILYRLLPITLRHMAFEVLGNDLLSLLQPSFLVAMPSSYGVRQRFRYFSPIFLGQISRPLLAVNFESQLEAILRGLPNTYVLPASAFSPEFTHFLDESGISDVAYCVQLRTDITHHGILLLGNIPHHTSVEVALFLSELCDTLIIIFERLLSYEELSEASSNLGHFNRQLQTKINLQARDLLKAKRHYAQTVSYKTDFLSKISHDLRTPLQVIKGVSQSVLSGQIGADRLNDAVHIIGNSVSRLKQMVATIQGATLADMPPPPPLQKVDLTVFFSGITQMMRPLLQGSSVSFKWFCTHALDTPYYFDELKVSQLLTNLLSNSVKHTSTGTISLSTAIVPVDDRQSLLEICVKDTGVGISKEVLPLLFEPTRSAQLSQVSGDGWGLGLSICLDILYHLGGELWVDPTVEIGTCVHARLPINLIEISSELTPPLPPEITPEDLDRLRQLKILLCDDDDLNRDYARMIFEGFPNIEIVSSGREAIERCRHTCFDLILMDIRMPDLNGVETLHHIRALPQPNTPFETVVKCPKCAIYRPTRTIKESEQSEDGIVEWGENRADGVCRNSLTVALTAQAMPQDEKTFLAQGFDAYLSKPATFSEIIGVIKKMIPHRSTHDS